MQSNQYIKPATSPDYMVQVAVRSDIGRIRQNNEDSTACIWPADENTRQRKGLLIVIADGMGGHAAGEQASRLCVDVLARQYYALRGWPYKALGLAVMAANELIYQTSHEKIDWVGMGTTCTAIAIVKDQLYWVQVGDSRAYLLRDGQLTRITPEHTLVAELIQKGLLTPEQARNHPERNVLSRAVGTQPVVTPDVGQMDSSLLIGDRLLLCSDGLYEYLTDSELTHLISQQADVDACADGLINEANRRGGADNISVAVVAIAPAVPVYSQSPTTRDIELPAL